MKKSKFTESQIVFPLQGDSAGCRVRYNETELQRRMNSPVGRVMVRGSFLAHAEIRELRSQFKSIKGG